MGFPAFGWVLVLATTATLLGMLVDAGDFGQTASVAFAPRRNVNSRPATLLLGQSLTMVRGGASRALATDEYEEEEEDEEEEDEEEEEEDEQAPDPKLAAAAMRSSDKTAAKAQAEKSSATKAAVGARLAASKLKKTTVAKSTTTATAATKKSSSLFRLPYIMRACLNPVTAYAMTKAFWLSLFDFDYPPKEASQDLRSSLEQKGRTGGAPPTRPKRKMKRGQAKTLADLPALNT